MGFGSKNIWINCQLVTGVSDPSQGSWSTLEVWADLKYEAVMLWDLGHLCRFSVKSEQTAGCPVGVGELVAFGRDPACLLSGTKPRLTVFFHLCLEWDSGAVYVEQNTQNPSAVLCTFRIPDRIWDLIKWVVTECVLSLSYHLHAVYPGIVPFATFTWEQWHQVSRDFWKDY